MFRNNIWPQRNKKRGGGIFVLIDFSTRIHNPLSVSHCIGVSGRYVELICDLLFFVQPIYAYCLCTYPSVVQLTKASKPKHPDANYMCYVMYIAHENFM